METVMVDSNHWLGWIQSALLLSQSPERYQSTSYWGGMSLNISHLPTRASLFCLITTESCMATSGDPRLPAWNLQQLIGQNEMQQVRIKVDWSRVGGRKGWKMRQDNECQVMSSNAGKEQNGGQNKPLIQKVFTERGLTQGQEANVHTGKAV